MILSDNISDDVRIGLDNIQSKEWFIYCKKYGNATTLSLINILNNHSDKIKEFNLRVTKGLSIYRSGHS